MTQCEDMINHAREFFDHYGDSIGEKNRRGNYFFPDFELDLSLFDFQFVFKKDFYYEIKYRDMKYNTIDTIAYGGSYKVKTNKGKGLNSSEVIVDRKSSVIEEGNKCLFDKRVNFSKTVIINLGLSRIYNL